MSMEFSSEHAVQRRKWEEYIRRTFDTVPDERERTPVTRERRAVSPPAPSTIEEIDPDQYVRIHAIQPGAVLAMPLRAEENSLPAGFYVLLSDPRLPVVTLCIAGRDAEGYLCTTDQRIHVGRDQMLLFKPVAGLRLY